MVHKHDGHIQSRIIYYLMNVHLTKRTIYLTRHGMQAGRCGVGGHYFGFGHV